MSLIATQLCTFPIHWKWQSWGFYFVWLPGWRLTAVINNIHTEQLWWCLLRFSFLSSCWFCECFECNTHQFTQMNNMDYWSVVFDSCGYFAIILVLLVYWLYSIIIAGQGWHHQDSSIRIAASRWTEVEVFLFVFMLVLSVHCICSFLIVGGFVIVVVLLFWWFCHVIWFTLCLLNWRG